MAPSGSGTLSLKNSVSVIKILKADDNPNFPFITISVADPSLLKAELAAIQFRTSSMDLYLMAEVSLIKSSVTSGDKTLIKLSLT